MIFWIILGLVALATVTYSIYFIIELDFLSAMGVLIGSLLVGLLLMLLLAIWVTPSPEYREGNTHDLVALQTSSSTEGRSFFLGSGYVNGKRTLNYITNDDGAYRVMSADADNSVVYQDSELPTVLVMEWDIRNPWLAPWSFGSAQTYEFHIPEGSILSDFTVDNG